MAVDVLIQRNGFARRETVKAYQYGRLAVHRCLGCETLWIVTHPESGMSVTGGKRFDSRAQAKRYAEEIQRHLDFSRLTCESDQRDVQKTYGPEAIRKAMSAAFQEAYGA